MKRIITLGVVILSTFGGSSTAQAQGYDGITAGIEAYNWHEGARRDAVSRQLGTIGELKWYSGLDRWATAGDYFDVAPSLDAIYAEGVPRRFGPADHGDIFEPWPAVPGDIWGYPHYESVRQPLGHRSIRTGPDRWEYHPIYADELHAEQPPPPDRRTPPVRRPPPIPAEEALPPDALDEPPAEPAWESDGDALPPPVVPPRRFSTPREF